MGAIVLDASKVNSYVLPNLVKSKNTMQDAYSTSQSLRNSLPSSFTYRSTINDIVNQLYSIKREISDIDTMISKKVERAKTIENRNDNRASGIAKAASSIGSIVGTIGGAAIGARTGGVVGAAAGAVVGNKVGSAVGKTIVDTGAKVVKGFTSVCKKISTGIKTLKVKVVRKITSLSSKLMKKVVEIPKFLIQTRAKISNKIVSAVENVTGWDLNWIKKINSKVSNFVVSIVDKAGNLASNLVKGLGNWVADLIENPWATIKKTAATVVNLVVSVVEGLVSFAEALVDVVALAAGAVLSLGSFFVDLYNGVFNNNWDWSATGTVWKKWIIPFVSTDWTSKAFDGIYKWAPMQKLNNAAYDWAKRGNIGCEIGKGVGYYVGVIVLSIITCGAAAGAVGATSASSAAATQVIGSVTLKTVTTAGSVAIGSLGQNVQKNYNKTINSKTKEYYISQIMNANNGLTLEEATSIVEANLENNVYSDVNEIKKSVINDISGKEIAGDIGKALGKATIDGGIFFAAGAAGDTIGVYGKTLNTAKEFNLPINEKTIKTIEFLSKNKNNVQTTIKASKAYISEGYSCLINGEKYDFGEATMDAASIVVAEKAANLFNTKEPLKKIMYQVPKDSSINNMTDAAQETAEQLTGTISESSSNVAKVGFKEVIKYSTQNGLYKGEEKLIKEVASSTFENVVN